MRPFGIPNAWFLPLLLVAAMSWSGCGESSTEPEPEPEAMTIADLVGSWIASSMVFTNQANPAQKLDVVAAGGELRVTVLNGGGARTWLEFGAASDEWDALLTVSGDRLTSKPLESSRPTRIYTVTLEDARMTLTRSDATFDFSLSGAAELPATETTVFVRH